ncbi:hypothetical protein K2173_007427 [Erythroxylum novogranatense]|uniref:Uncharacterized protein n=1 Tax=Erythroxylum novogranatense TaxID=1862640 RepID=A0AAV8S5T6_9ROSI|nr:hypothetical protein K2173_007427 [Erythroxylum novogranatense]
MVIGTWDDYDYGLNDAGKEFGGKVTDQRLLLDFLDEPQDSLRFMFSDAERSLLHKWRCSFWRNFTT